MSNDLFIVRLVLDRRELIRVAARHRLPHGVDEGYLLHAGLAQLFARSSEPADVPLHSFAIDDTNPGARADAARLYLLAYSTKDEASLREAMGPAQRVALHSCATRPVPSIALGTRARFRTRICPVVRTKRAGDRPLHVNSKGRAVSREVDAWLAERLKTWNEDPPRDEAYPFQRRGDEWLDRERVYTSWLERELGRGGASALEPGTQMESFERVVAYRGRETTGRRSTIQRPSAVLSGTLRVTAPAAFRSVLARGLGRHRAFGFGMLLVRPA